jgi:hypothetical protein
MYFNVPHTYEEHRSPVDCWRFYGDAGEALASWGRDNSYNVELIETAKIDQNFPVGFYDTVMIFYKGQEELSEERSVQSQLVLTQITQHFSNFSGKYAQSVKDVLVSTTAAKLFGYTCQSKGYPRAANGSYYRVTSDCDLEEVYLLPE